MCVSRADHLVMDSQLVLFPGEDFSPPLSIPSLPVVFCVVLEPCDHVAPPTPLSMSIGVALLLCLILFWAKSSVHQTGLELGM